MVSILGMLLAISVGSGNDALSAPSPGATIGQLALQDIHRRPRSLSDYKDKKAFVVVFIGAECPLANLYVPTLNQLHEKYSKQGVQILAVNSNVQDSFNKVSAHAQERGIPFPVLKDFDHSAVDEFGATRTPEAFLLDAQGVIRYHGRIDDQYGVNYQRNEARERFLVNALDELLAGKPVTNPTTALQGCLIGRRKSLPTDQEVTYTKDIARIFQKRCQECHRPGEIGPFPLMNYQQAVGWADMIREVVLEERMPPWHADPRHGKFLNDRRMPADEIKKLLAWVDQDCPKGDEKDMPPPVEFTSGWTIGKPDVVFEMPEEYKVPATGVLPYLNFTVDPGFMEDMWVQLAEARPGNREVVHHIIVYIQQKGKELYEPDGTAFMLAGWAPGDMPTIFQEGAGKRIPAGSKLIFEVHYTPNGKAQTDRSSVGIIFSDEPPKYEAKTNVFARMALTIPPGAKQHREEFSYTFKEPGRVLSFMPHMHLRGLSARYEAEYPDGRKETLLYVPDYDFNWQSIYRFSEPKYMPAGTKVSWVAQWDNSADNPRNPDATKKVTWGLQTWDEMMNGWMEIIREREPPTKSAAR